MSAEKKVNEVAVFWNESTRQWRLETANGIFIQEFYDCGNFPIFFPTPNKGEKNLYKIVIEKVDDLSVPQRSWM